MKTLPRTPSPREARQRNFLSVIWHINNPTIRAQHPLNAIANSIANKEYENTTLSHLVGQSVETGTWMAARGAETMAAVGHAVPAAQGLGMMVMGNGFQSLPEGSGLLVGLVGEAVLPKSPQLGLGLILGGLAIDQGPSMANEGHRIYNQHNSYINSYFYDSEFSSDFIPID